MNSMPNIYMINLDRDVERLAFVSGQLDNLRLSFDRISAIYGIDMPKWLKPYFLDETGGIASPLTPGEVGCYASHLLAMSRIAEGSVPAIIMEDDLRLAPDFCETIAVALAALPSDLDMLKLTLPGRRRHFSVRDLGNGRHIVKFGKVPTGTGAYLVTPAGAKRFLAYKTLRSIPIDQELRLPWLCPLKVYGLTPAPAEQNVLSSTIATFGASRAQKFDQRTFSESLARIRYELGWLGPLVWARSLIKR